MPRTWAPKGKTPRIKHNVNGPRLSAIGGIDLSGEIYFRVHEESIKSGQVMEYPGAAPQAHRRARGRPLGRAAPSQVLGREGVRGGARRSSLDLQVARVLSRLQPGGVALGRCKVEQDEGVLPPDHRRAQEEAESSRCDANPSLPHIVCKRSVPGWPTRNNGRTSTQVGNQDEGDIRKRNIG